MSKERKTPGTPEIIVTPDGAWYQLPLFAGMERPLVTTDFFTAGGDWEDLYQSWLAHLAECGYPAWPNSTAFYLGLIDELFAYSSNPHK